MPTDIDRSLEIVPASQPRAAGESWFFVTKRIFDIGFALFLVPFGVVAVTVVFLLNPFFNPGPIFFGQLRVGRFGVPFRMYKLRTMVGDNDEVRFASSENHRMTAFGRFIRRSHMDEFPQLLNILRGEMSFVGPRPEQVKFYDAYAAAIPNFTRRQIARPGISGLAQLELGYTDDEEGARKKLEYDLEYIENPGWKADAGILFRSVVVPILHRPRARE